MTGEYNLDLPSESERAITEPVLRRLAGGPAFHRGREYFEHGHVGTVSPVDDGVELAVRGARRYKVLLSVEDGLLDYSCDCEAGAEGTFCKHCVAAALKWVATSTKSGKLKGKKRRKKLTLADTAPVLHAQEKAALVDLLMEAAQRDKGLEQRLILLTAREEGVGVHIATHKDHLRKAIRTRRFLAYREARTYAQRVGAAIDALEQIFQDGHSYAVIELCEFALELIDGAVAYVDDSDGFLTEFRERLESLHWDACEDACPEPVALAERLFKIELESSLDVFYEGVVRYQKILGPSGVAKYRELAETEWAKVPVVQEKDEYSFRNEHFRITQIMQALAEQSGDIEELVAVLSRDLSSAYQYWRIATVYGEAGRHDAALAWAERGLKAFPHRTDRRLREFAANEYHRRGRHKEAMALMWQGFRESPFIEEYRSLEEHARKAGTWEEWRERALTAMRSDMRKQRGRSKRSNLYRFLPGADHSRLVEVFLYEGDVESAWHEAKEGGCGDGLWLQLADLRAKEHPEESSSIYFNQAEIAIRRAHGSDYGEAVELLVKAAALMNGLNRHADFERQLAALREQHKRKTNFMKLLSQKESELLRH